MSENLKGKVALITGSTRGIGRAIAISMAEAGCNIVISSRRQDACDDLAAEINAQSDHVSALACAANIAEKEDLRRLTDATLQKWGRIDILICNAATNPYYGTMSGISDDAFRTILSNNILSNHWLVQFARPGMVEQRDGVIIVVSSIGGLRGSSVIGAYNISKAADMQLVRNLAMELGPYGIRVNCLAPGLIKTDFSKAIWNDAEKRRQHESLTPLRRIGEPADIAGAALFLASPASRFLTGQTIVVDGGATIVGL
ncbi:MAG: SDR family oxidoreductase [Beijerinckiaceae bacterium]|nr:SDR family oxidoreductase [Beijerinckiaceae bacterium]